MALERLSISIVANTIGEFVSAERDGDLDLSPPYQRPSVWTHAQRTELIRSLLRGIPVPAIYVNRRAITEPMRVVDGKQRLEAILEFVRGDLGIPAEWLDDELPDGWSDPEAGYPDASGRFQRIFRISTTVPVCATTFANEHAEREAVRHPELRRIASRSGD
jgi:hypothetical protein